MSVSVCARVCVCDGGIELLPLKYMKKEEAILNRGSSLCLHQVVYNDLLLVWLY